MPIASIIIPLYNKEKYIARAIDSILNQTITDIEIIIVNDGSTDQSIAVVEKYNDERIHLYHQENAGPGAARNHGFRKSNGTYINFLDADDEMMPTFLETSIQHLKEYPECKISVCGHYRTEDKICWKPPHEQVHFPEGPWQIPTDRPVNETILLMDCYQMSSVVCDRTAIESVDGFYENKCVFGEDTHFWLQLAVGHTTYFNPEPLTWYHTEASELGVGRETPNPVPPHVFDPKAIYHHCPEKLKPYLDGLIDYYALIALWHRMTDQDHIGVRNILKEYPKTNNFWMLYLKTKIKYFASRLLPGKK